MEMVIPYTEFHGNDVIKVQFNLQSHGHGALVMIYNNYSIQ